MRNTISGLEKHVERVQGQIVECERNMEQSREEFVKPFVYEFQLKSKLNRQMEINSALDIGEGKEEDIQDKQQK